MDVSVLVFLMIRRPPRSTLFPSRRSSDLRGLGRAEREIVGATDADLYDAPRAARHEEELRIVLTEGRSVERDRKSTRLNSSHSQISYAVFCLKKKKKSKPYQNLGYHTHYL